MPFIQISTPIKGDPRSQFSSCNPALYFTHRYGSCSQCSSLIQTPGLDHSYCSGCNAWIASRSIIAATIETAPSVSQALLRSSIRALPRPELKPAVSQQLDLWGGLA